VSNAPTGIFSSCIITSGIITFITDNITKQTARNKKAAEPADNPKKINSLLLRE
jgi:hypothetical protein